MPTYRVMDELRWRIGRASKLDKAGDHGPEFLRQKIIAHVPMDRAIFELQRFPKSRSAKDQTSQLEESRLR